MPEPIEATCAGCDLLCDDIPVTLDDGQISLAPSAPACAKAWFSTQLDQLENEDSAPNLTEFKTLIQNAGQILICGLEGLTLEETTAAIEFAERHEAIISTGRSTASIETFQRYGGVGCSLGEIRHRPI